MTANPPPSTAPAPHAVHRRPSRWSPRSFDGQVRLFLLPFLLGSLLLIVLPAAITIAVAFTKYNAITAPTWVGLDNFRTLLMSPLARLSLRSSLQFIFLAVPLRVLGALALALLLQPAGRLFGGLRAAAYLPTIIPEGAFALIFLWILNPLYGPLNAVLGAVGLPTPDWLLNPTTARLSFVLMAARGIFGKWLYRKSAGARIRRIREEFPDPEGIRGGLPEGRFFPVRFFSPEV